MSESNDIIPKHHDFHSMKICDKKSDFKLYDVIIIGAGVAGSALAIHLNNLMNSRRSNSNHEKFKILVVEMENKIEDKIIGEFMQPQGLNILKNMNLLDSVINDRSTSIPVFGYCLHLPQDNKIPSETTYITYPIRKPESFLEKLGFIDHIDVLGDNPPMNIVKKEDPDNLLPGNNKYSRVLTSENIVDFKQKVTQVDHVIANGFLFHNNLFIENLRAKMREENCEITLLEGYRVTSLIKKKDIKNYIINNGQGSLDCLHELSVFDSNDQNIDSDEVIGVQYESVEKGNNFSKNHQVGIKSFQTDKQNTKQILIGIDHQKLSKHQKVDPELHNTCDEYKTNSNNIFVDFGKLICLCDGGSNLDYQKTYNKQLYGRKKLSSWVSVIMEHTDYDFPLSVAGLAYVVLCKPSPVIIYQLSPSETRFLACLDVEIPDNDYYKYLHDSIFPQLSLLSEKFKKAFLTALEKRKFHVKNVYCLPSRSSTTNRLVAVGDSLNMRHAITGSGMTIALNDVMILAVLISKEDLSNPRASLKISSKLCLERQNFALPLNILSNCLHSVFSTPSEGLYRNILRLSCFKYLARSKRCSVATISMISGLNPDFFTLLLHFFSVVFFGVFHAFSQMQLHFDCKRPIKFGKNFLFEIITLILAMLNCPLMVLFEGSRIFFGHLRNERFKCHKQLHK